MRAPHLCAKVRALSRWDRMQQAIFSDRGGGREGDGKYVNLSKELES